MFVSVKDIILAKLQNKFHTLALFATFVDKLFREGIFPLLINV